MMGTHVKPIVSTDFQSNLLSNRIIFFQQLTFSTATRVIFKKHKSGYKMLLVKVTKCFQLHLELEKENPYPVPPSPT